MTAIGFGQRVDGGGENPARIRRVTKVGNDADEEGTLPYAIKAANEASTEGRGYPRQEILIRLADDETRIKPNPTPLVVTARNLTIRAVRGAVIERNCLTFDCSKADNVLLRNLRFASDGKDDGAEGVPPDTIRLDATEGRGEIGFWIDHCEFEAYHDLNITSHATDLDRTPPLLITVSHCRFFDEKPSGSDHENHGAMTFSDDRKESGLNQRTNTYATVCRNVFQTVRRRSPRTSGRSVVHAFNNLLLGWGSKNPGDDQQNGMEVGKAGILVAQANYFKADVLKAAIKLTSETPPPRLTVPDSGVKQNKYANGAVKAHSHGAHVDIGRAYRDALGNKADIPQAATMTDRLRADIESQAGPGD